VALIGTFFFALIFALMLEIKNSNVLPLVFITTAVGIVYPILIQGQQRGIHYFSVPILLFICSVYSMKYTLNFLSRQMFLRFCSQISIAALIILVVASSTWTRAWYTDTPFGQSLTQPRKDISKLVSPSSSICLAFKMPIENRDFFIGGMGGVSGFLLPPINAASVHFEHLGECDAKVDSNLHIELAANNTYLISLEN
jgi:hypothetical protein